MNVAAPQSKLLSWIYRGYMLAFFLYLAAYGVFVALNAYWPGVMKTPAFAGVNLAVVYGFGLIIGAFVLAVIYALLSGKKDAS